MILVNLQNLNRYRIVKVLGQGAMGVVYEAHDPNIDRHVAIKTIRLEDLGADLAADYERRFKIEARAAGRLNHPNIVGVYDAGRDADMAYLVMELVQGSDLRASLNGGVRYTLGQSLQLMAELLGALEFAHGQSVVHRDVKPSNVMLDGNGHVKLTDFGLARLVDGGEATRTRGGSALGTPRYMSPEQVRGEKVDARTDLFSAGVIFYQLVTGVAPFEGEGDFVVMRNICLEPHRPPTSLNPALPPALDAVMDKLLAKTREDRFATAAEVAVALSAIARDAVDSSLKSLPALPASGSVASTDSLAANLNDLAAVLPAAAVEVTGTASSTVLQEHELMRWKEVQGSSAARDFERFLQQFPSGVYADLAKRRLRRIAGLSGSTTQVDVFVPPPQPSRPPIAEEWSFESAAADDDATRMISAEDRSAKWLSIKQLSGTGENDTPLAQGAAPGVAASAAEQNPSMAAPSLPAPAPPPVAPIKPISEQPSLAAAHAAQDALRRRAGLWWAGGAVAAAVLLAVGFWMSASPPKETVATVEVAPALVVSAPTSQPAAATETGVSAVVLAATESGTAPRASTESEGGSLKGPAAVGVAAPIAAMASASAKPPRPKAKPVVLPGPVRAPAPTPAPSEVAPPVAAMPALPEVKKGPSSPSEACADRTFLTRSMCQYKQCQLPQFKDHPECVAMREREQERENDGTR